MKISDLGKKILLGFLKLIGEEDEGEGLMDVVVGFFFWFHVLHPFFLSFFYFF